MIILSLIAIASFASGGMVCTVEMTNIGSSTLSYTSPSPCPDDPEFTVTTSLSAEQEIAVAVDWNIMSDVGSLPSLYTLAGQPTIYNYSDYNQLFVTLVVGADNMIDAGVIFGMLSLAGGVAISYAPQPLVCPNNIDAYATCMYDHLSLLSLMSSCGPDSSPMQAQATFVCNMPSVTPAGDYVLALKINSTSNNITMVKWAVGGSPIVGPPVIPQNVPLSIDISCSPEIQTTLSPTCPFVPASYTMTPSASPSPSESISPIATCPTDIYAFSDATIAQTLSSVDFPDCPARMELSSATPFAYQPYIGVSIPMSIFSPPIIKLDSVEIDYASSSPIGDTNIFVVGVSNQSTTECAVPKLLTPYLQGFGSHGSVSPPNACGLPAPYIIRSHRFVFTYNITEDFINIILPDYLGPAVFVEGVAIKGETAYGYVTKIIKIKSASGCLPQPSQPCFVAPQTCAPNGTDVFYFFGPLITDSAGIAHDFDFYDGDNDYAIPTPSPPPLRKRVIDNRVPLVNDPPSSSFLNQAWNRSYEQYLFQYNTPPTVQDPYTYGAVLSQNNNCGMHVHVLGCSANVQVWFAPTATGTFESWPVPINTPLLAFSCAVISNASAFGVVPLTVNTHVSSRPINDWQNLWIINFTIVLYSLPRDNYFDLSNEIYGFEVQKPLNSPEDGIYIRCDKGEELSGDYLPLFNNTAYCESNPDGFAQTGITVITDWNTTSTPPSAVVPPTAQKEQNLHIFGAPMCPAYSLCFQDAWFFSTPYEYVVDYVGPAFMFPNIFANDLSVQVKPYDVYYSYMFNNSAYMSEFGASDLNVTMITYAQLGGIGVFEYSIIPSSNSPFFGNGPDDTCPIIFCTDFDHDFTYYYQKASILEGFELGTAIRGSLNGIPNTHVKIGYNLQSCLETTIPYYIALSNNTWTPEEALRNMQLQIKLTEDLGYDYSPSILSRFLLHGMEFVSGEKSVLYRPSPANICTRVPVPYPSVCVECDPQTMLIGFQRDSNVSVVEYPGCHGPHSSLPLAMYKIDLIDNNPLKFAPFVGLQTPSFPQGSFGLNVSIGVEFYLITEDPSIDSGDYGQLFPVLAAVQACDQLDVITTIGCAITVDLCSAGQGGSPFPPGTHTYYCSILLRDAHVDPIQYATSFAILFPQVSNATASTLLVSQVNLFALNVDTGFTVVLQSIISEQCNPIATTQCMSVGCDATNANNRVDQLLLMSNSDAESTNPGYLTGPFIIDNANFTGINGYTNDFAPRRAIPLVVLYNEPPSLNNIYPDGSLIDPYQSTNLRPGYTVDNIGSKIAIDNDCGFYFHEKGDTSSVQVWLRPNMSWVSPSIYEDTAAVCFLLMDSPSSYNFRSDKPNLNLAQGNVIPLTPNLYITEVSKTENTFYFDQMGYDPVRQKAYRINLLVRRNYDYYDGHHPVIDDNLYGFEIRRLGVSPQSGYYIKCDLFHSWLQPVYTDYGNAAFPLSTPYPAIPLYENTRICVSSTDNEPSATDTVVFNNLASVEDYSGAYFAPMLNYYFTPANCIQNPMCSQPWYISTPYTYTTDYVGGGFILPALPLPGPPAPPVEEALPVNTIFRYDMNSPALVSLVNQNNTNELYMRIYIALGVQATNPNNTDVFFYPPPFNRLIQQIRVINVDDQCAQEAFCAGMHISQTLTVTWQQASVLGAGGSVFNRMFNDHYTLELYIGDCINNIGDQYYMSNPNVFEGYMLEIHMDITGFLANLTSQYYSSNIFNHVLVEGFEFYSAPYNIPIAYKDTTSLARTFSNLSSVIYTPPRPLTCRIHDFTPNEFCGFCGPLPLVYFPDANIPNNTLQLAATHPNATNYDDVGWQYNASTFTDELIAASAHWSLSVAERALVDNIAYYGAAYVYNASLTTSCYVSFNSTIIYNLLNENGDSIAFPFPSFISTAYTQSTEQMAIYGTGAAFCVDIVDFEARRVRTIHPTFYYAFFDGYYANCVQDIALGYNTDTDIVCTDSNQMFPGKTFSVYYPDFSVIMVARTQYPTYLQYNPLSVYFIIQPIVQELTVMFINASLTFALPDSYDLQGADPTPIVFRFGKNWNSMGILGAPLSVFVGSNGPFSVNSGVGRYYADRYTTSTANLTVIYASCLPPTECSSMSNCIVTAPACVTVPTNYLPGVSRFRFVSTPCTNNTYIQSESESQSHSLSRSASHESNSQSPTPPLYTQSQSHQSKSKSHHSKSESASHESDSQSASHQSDSLSASHESDSQSASHQSDSRSASHGSDSQSASHQSDSLSASHESGSKSASHQSDSLSASHESDSQSASHESDSRSTSHDSKSHSKSHDSKSHSKSHHSNSQSQTPPLYTNSPSHNSKSQSHQSNSQSQSHESQSQSHSLSQSASPAGGLCCDRSTVIGYALNESSVCYNNPLDPACHSLINQPVGPYIYGCDPAEAPLHILAGGIYQVTDYFIPYIGPSTPFANSLRHVGLRVGYIWLSFSNEFAEGNAEVNVRFTYTPGKNLLSLEGTAFGRIMTDDVCFPSDTSCSLWPQLYHIDMEITSGIVPITGKGSNRVVFITQATGPINASGSFYPLNTSTYPVPVINFTLTDLSGLVVIPEIMPLVQPFLPAQMLMGIDMPNVYPGVYTALAAIQVNCSGAEFPFMNFSDPQTALLSAACSPFFPGEPTDDCRCPRTGLIMFNVEDVCNAEECPPTPTPGICPLHPNNHSRSHSHSHSSSKSQSESPAHPAMHMAREEHMAAVSIDTDTDTAAPAQTNTGVIIVVFIGACVISMLIAVMFIKPNTKTLPQASAKSVNNKKVNAHASDWVASDGEDDDDTDIEDYNTNNKNNNNK
jgi:hypothetical protein